VVCHLGEHHGQAGMRASATPPLVKGGDVVHWMHCPEVGKPISSTLAAGSGDQITCVVWVKVPRDFANEELGEEDLLRVRMDGGTVDAHASSQSGGQLGSWNVLLVGTRSGALQVHNSGGSLMLRQRLHESPVMNVQVTG